MTTRLRLATLLSLSLIATVVAQQGGSTEAEKSQGGGPGQPPPGGGPEGNKGRNDAGSKMSVLRTRRLCKFEGRAGDYDESTLTFTWNYRNVAMVKKLARGRQCVVRNGVNCKDYERIVLAPIPSQTIVWGEDITNRAINDNDYHLMMYVAEEKSKFWVVAVDITKPDKNEEFPMGGFDLLEGGPNPTPVPQVPPPGSTSTVFVPPAGGPKFSPDGKRIGLIACRDGKWSVVVFNHFDKKVVEYNQIFADIEAGTLTWSPDSSLVAWCGQLKPADRKKYIYVWNGKPDMKIEWFDAGEGIFEGTLKFTPDSKRIVYACQEKWGGKPKVFVKHAELRGKQPPAEPKYLGQGKPGEFGVGPGVKAALEGFDDIGEGSPVLSEDSRRIALAARRGKKWVVVVDGKEYGPWDGICEGTPLFSDNSKRCAWGYQENTNWVITCLESGLIPSGEDAPKESGKKIDRKKKRDEGMAGTLREVARGDGILRGTPRFGKTNFLYFGIRANGLYKMGGEYEGGVERVESPAYKMIKEDTFRFSEDDKQWCFVGANGDLWTPVFKGKPMKGRLPPDEKGESKEAFFEYQQIGLVRLSRGSATIAFLAKRHNNWVVVVNGEEYYKWYHDVIPIAISLSPDGTRVGYTARLFDKWSLFIDARRMDFEPYTYTFTDDNRLIGLIRDKNDRQVHLVIEEFFEGE